MRILVQRFFGFSAVPLLAFVAPLFLLPIVSRMAGVDGWAAIGTAQAIGALCAMIASFGWNVVGSARIALAEDAPERLALYADSFWTRLIVFAVVAGAGATIAAALTPDDYTLLVVLVTFATGTAALTITWFGVGAGSARVILLFETLPITGAVLIAVPLLLVTGELILYPILMTAGSIVGVILLHLHLYRRLFPPLDLRRLRRAFAHNAAVAASDGVGATYTSAPIPVAQALSGSSAAAQLTSADRIYRLALVAVTVLGNTLQKWVLEVSYAEGRLRRQLIALGMHLVLAVVGGVLLLVAGPVATDILLGSEVAAPREVFVGYGVTFAIIALTTPLVRNVLVPAGRNKTVLVATGSAAAVGVPAMLLLGGHGAAAIVGALAASEVVVLAIVGTVSARILINAHREVSTP